MSRELSGGEEAMPPFLPQLWRHHAAFCDGAMLAHRENIKGILIGERVRRRQKRHRRRPVARRRSEAAWYAHIDTACILQNRHVSLV